MGSGEGASDLFVMKTRLELPRRSRDCLECQAKITIGGLNFFAVSMKYSGDLLLMSDGNPRLATTPEVAPLEKKWSLKMIPWFEDGNKIITALTFDDDGVLYIGTRDGNIYELHAVKMIEDSPGRQQELRLLFSLNELRVIQLVVWHRENLKMILCNGDNNKLAIIHPDALPVLVTFLSNISHLEIFTNNVGLSCLLVCLENNTNVYCVLDDLEIPNYEPEEVHGKKSIFRKARDNFMSKFSEEKMNFFNRKTNKEGGNMNAQKQPSAVVSSASVSATLGGSNRPSAHKFPISNVKFSPIEEVHCRGILRKVCGRSQFCRHINNKLDIFDVDFRQTAAVYIPTHINRLFVIQRIFFGIDEENRCIRVSVIHSGTLKEFAIIPMHAKVISIEPVDQDDPSVAPYSVFIISRIGIFEVQLAKSPIDTCVDMLLRETNNVMLDVVCNALNVVKSSVCTVAGDKRAEEGKFAKAILYYKIAGLNYMKIMAKFGSRGHIAAMLCFYELMDQEQKSKLSGNNQDRQAMANLGLLGRIEQYLRHGKGVSDASRNPKNLLRNMLTQNPHYSAKQAASWMCNVPLLWGLKILGSSRLCYPHILSALEASGDTRLFTRKKAFWEILTADWLALYTAPPTVFSWFRDVVLQSCRDIHIKHLHALILVLLPWRRELQHKFFDPRSPHTAEIIDFTVTNDAGRVPVEQYINLFITLLLEVIRREDPRQLILPNFVFKTKYTESLLHREHARRSSDPKSLSAGSQQWHGLPEKSFAASSHHCACIRNGKMFTWGENKLGRLGHADDRPVRLNVESPTAVDISPSLRLSVDAISCGINHNLALTSVGTLLTWGSNALGQLGLGAHAIWTTRPVPVALSEDVIVSQVAAGGYHSVAVDSLNRVWTWGWGIHGQLGDGTIESKFLPQLISVPEKIMYASAGHCHTALLSVTGQVYTFGCAHFGQIGQGLPQRKVKVPMLVTEVPSGVTFRIVEAGLCGTAMVSTRNRLYYAGLNPGTLRTLLSGQKRREQRNNALAAGVPQSEIVFEEEKDFYAPVLIETGHLSGEIVKVNVATTHMCVLTSTGMVYTWGLGKSGQLVRPDDDSRTLELIDTEDRTFVAADICCGGDCTFVIEKDSYRCFGCGFNSSGQLGKLQSEEESAVMTIKTKKRVVKVRQPSNIYFRLREIVGLPKPMWRGEAVPGHVTSPNSLTVDQELLEWFLRAFKRHYDPTVITETCIEYENFDAASLLETMAENHEFALKHSLSLRAKRKGHPSTIIANYLHNREKANTVSLDQACRFLRVVVIHWAENSLPGSDLEEILEPHMSRSPWNALLRSAVRDIIASSDDSAQWIAGNMTPVFILKALSDVTNGTIAAESLAISPSTTAPSSADPVIMADAVDSPNSSEVVAVPSTLPPDPSTGYPNGDAREEGLTTRVTTPTGMPPAATGILSNESFKSNGIHPQQQQEQQINNTLSTTNNKLMVGNGGGNNTSSDSNGGVELLAHNNSEPISASLTAQPLMEFEQEP